MTRDSAVVETAAELLDARIGLKSEPSFRPRLVRALRDLADARHVDRAGLVAALASDSSLLDHLVDRVTVQESAFFRHPEQFESIRCDVLPLIHEPVRAWSAACANGQEAYSLAMLLAESCGSGSCGAGSILASDISRSALRRTAIARYSNREMAGVSADRRVQHFTTDGDTWRLNQGLRDMVRVEQHNLLDPVPPEVAECQLVLCRNVLIYFNRQLQDRALGLFHESLSHRGILGLGSKESIDFSAYANHFDVLDRPERLFRKK